MIRKSNLMDVTPYDDEPSVATQSPEKALAIIWGVEAVKKVPEEKIAKLVESQASGNRDDFLAFLDDLSTEFLEQNNPDFYTNIQAMRATRDKDAQTKWRNRQRRLYDQAQAYILDIAGLSADASKTDMDLCRDSIQAKLRAEPDADPLLLLGIVKQDQEGNDMFVYPTGLFPKQTDDRWTRYIDTVNHHIKVSNNLVRGTSAQADVVAADFERRNAHNAFARDLQQILGSPEDDFEEYRKLAVKMREHRFPNVETSERARTSALLVGSTVVNALHKHLLPADAIFGGDDW